MIVLFSLLNYKIVPEDKATPWGRPERRADDRSMGAAPCRAASLRLV
jgi:hypothetical protein